MTKFKSPILKLALFATGLSGIVAEYILSTLATNFLGDSVFQWSMILSVMLFSMGIGSRLSKYFTKHLLETFIAIELLLSFFVSYSSLFAYTASSFTIYTGLIIYTLSIIIGVFIGLEIPLVIRLNDSFQSLRINIAAVMEMDYLGSLVGGLFFVFIGLPYLGLTYTPFVLGLVNFMVAMLLFLITRKELKNNNGKKVMMISSFVLVVLSLGFFIAKPLILFGEQQKYQDKIVYEKQSKYQKIVITEWKDNYWLYINGNLQLSTLDEDKYHEVIVHPIMTLNKAPQDVLILGGGDGCAVREVLKYPTVNKVTLVDLDPEMTKVGQEHPVFVDVNKNALNHSKVKVLNEDGYTFLEQTKEMYDVIIVDLPDPKSVELGRLYSYEFYKLCNKQLRKNGFIITQAGSPYYNTKAYNCIDLTLTKAGFSTAKLHNQVLTLGEWGWVLGAKNEEKEKLNQKLKKLSFDHIKTKWIDNEAMQLITSFGKNIYFDDSSIVEVNQIHNPVLYHYYLKGNWDTY